MLATAGMSARPLKRLIADCKTGKPKTTTACLNREIWFETRGILAVDLDTVNSNRPAGPALASDSTATYNPGQHGSAPKTLA
jgi:hypothetical protein